MRVGILLTSILFYLSCKKETLCKSCIDGNHPPFAIAGLDQVITLPTDSISLDGRSSSDPDGTISEWLWTHIAGPASLLLIIHQVHSQPYKILQTHSKEIDNR